MIHNGGTDAFSHVPTTTMTTRETPRLNGLKFGTRNTCTVIKKEWGRGVPFTTWSSEYSDLTGMYKSVRKNRMDSNVYLWHTRGMKRGACWSHSQGSIDGYEMSFSQMAHNNQAFGEPILILQSEGDSVDIQHDLNGTIKTLSMGTDDKASYLSSQSASESYMKQIDTLYKMIYEQSFSVIPPELKSGDLPAAALKILYSPAYEKAMIDAAEYQDVLRDMVELFAYGYGVETENTIAFGNLNMRYYIEPYVHINNSAVVADLASAVQNGFMSVQTAAEKLETIYTTNAEYDRILKENKENREAALADEIAKKKATLLASAKNNSSTSGKQNIKPS